MLQPDAVWHSHRELLPRARRADGRRRLAATVERNIALRDALRPIATRFDTTVSAVAVAWTLAWEGVTGAIVGARSANQIDGWIDAATLDLTGADLAEIDAALRRVGAGHGPTRPALLAA